MNKLKLITLAIIFISLTTNAFAIGITPGRIIIDYEPGKEQSGTFKVLNNEQKDMQVLIYLAGELNQTITLYDAIVPFSSIEGEKEFNYDIKLPQEITEPGDHQTQIIAMELPTVEGGGAYVGATVAVATQVIIRVPYPGKYLKASLEVQSAQPGGEITFIVPLLSLGEQDIAEARAKIDILGPTNEVINSIETNTISIPAKTKKELAAKWKADVNPGNYHAVATVFYDGKSARAEKTFSIGNLFIEVVDIKVSEFTLGGIAKFNIVAENKWNDMIRDVFAEMIISDEAGAEVARFKSASVDFPALKKEELITYWDTKGIKEGKYNAKVILHYAGKTSEKNLKTTITLNAIRFEELGGTARVVSEEGEGLSKNTWLAILVIVLIGINISWFFYIRKRRRDRENG